MDKEELDRLADEFESAWGKDERPSLKGFLDQVDGDLQASLAELLIPIDAEYRSKNGERICVQDYQTLAAIATPILEGLLKSLALNQQESEFDEFGETLDFQALPASQDPFATDASNEIDDLLNRDPATDKGNSQTIGPYQLLHKLGEGGMGAVWMANQVRPVKRRVALKLIKAGVGSREIIARFDAERQALALMNHPNIARILDAGATSDGQPFFVMELVEGVPLTTYCDRNRLNIDDRLNLFSDVCLGVQHAHQKGIIHRDLKPGNIIVGMRDGKPVPKIIDFGLAKAMETTQRLTDQSLFTGVGQILGTLKYMSPEQASLDEIDIDTRTDIYALGVILYELLAGSTPLDASSMKGQAMLKVLEFIRDRDPVKPSSRLSSSSDEQQSSITNMRKTDRGRLNRMLAGDLDWIVMKALEKDRNRRYETASEFSADIQRYLGDDPVIARPPSLNYRIKKFARKNRTGVIAASLLIFALVAGILGTTWGMLLASQRAQGEKNAKEKAQSLFIKEQASAQKALRSLEQVEKMVGVLSSIFDDLDIRNEENQSEPLEDRLAQRLVHASNQLDEQVVGNTTESAKLQSRLAIALLNLGYPIKANQTLERWADKIKKNQKVNDPELQTILVTYAAILTNRGRDEEAIAILEELGEWRKTAGTYGGPENLSYRVNLVDTLRAANRTDEAIEMGEEVVRDSIEMLGPNDYQTWLAKHALATAYGKAERNDDAVALHESFLPAMRSAMPNHPDTWTMMDGLAVEYSRNLRHDKSIQLHQEALKLKKESLSSSHPSVATSMFNLSVGLCNVGRIEEGLAMGLESSKLLEKRLGPTHDDTVFVKQALAKSFRSLSRIKEAISMQESLFKSFENAFGNNDVRTLASKGDLALLYRDADRVDECQKYLEEVYAIAKNNPQLNWVKRELATTYVMNRNIEQLDKLYPSFDNYDVPTDDPAAAYEFIQLIEVRVDIHLENGEIEKAKRLLRRNVQLCESSRQEVWKAGYFEFRLAEVFDEVGNRKQAKPFYVSAYKNLSANIDEIPKRMQAKLLATSAHRIAIFAEEDDTIDQRHWRTVSGSWLLMQENKPIPEEVSQKVKTYEAELESADDQYRVHNELRNLYFAFNEAKSFEHINAILRIRTMDKYMMDILTKHGDLETHLQANLLLAIASKYDRSKFLRAAAMVRASSLMGGQNPLSRKLLEQVAGTDDSDLTEYRELASSQLRKMQK